jgi:hypothetical protein
VQSQPAVQHLPVFADERQQRGLPGLQRTAAQGLDQRSQVGPGRTDDAHGAAAGCRGDGHDGIAVAAPGTLR